MHSNNTLRSYASNRVYDGKRPLPANVADKLRARHAVVKPPVRPRLWIPAFLISAGAILVHFVRTLTPHS